MKKKVIKIIALIFIILMVTTTISAVFNECQAVSDVTEDVDYWEPDEVVSTSLQEKIEHVLGVVSFIGIMISVVTLSVIGIKFMIGSAEEKAQYKQTLMPWLIGAILVFSVTSLPSIIYNIVHDGSNSNDTEQVQISINKSSVTLTVGENEEVTLKATVISDTNRIVKWTTSNSQIATVDSKGKVTARSVGTAIIKAYTGKAEATCKVIVDAVVTSNIEISKKSVTLDAPLTKSYQLTATITPGNSTEPIYWSSSDTNVAKVTNGKVIATGAGTTTITAKSGTKSATCTVQVNSSRVYEGRFYNPSTNEVYSSRKSTDDLEFLLYIPDISQVKNVDELPLIVFLHGGNPETLNSLKSGGNPFGLQNEDVNYPAICIFPKCYIPVDQSWAQGWATAALSDYKVIETLKGLIDYSTENYNVDENKIALTGPSNGGTATWEIGLKYPKLFSCLVTVSGYGAQEPKDGEEYPDCPVWVICSSIDSSRGAAIKLRDLLTEAGKKVKYDDRGPVDHDDMTKEAYTPDLINWMIERSRKTNANYKF